MHKAIVVTGAAIAAIAGSAGIANADSGYGHHSNSLINGDVVDVDKVCVDVARWHWNGPLNILSDAAPNGKCIIGTGVNNAISNQGSGNGNHVPGDNHGTFN